MKLEVNCLIAIVLVLGLCYPSMGWRSFKIIFTSFPYQFNSEIADVKIKIQNNSAGDTALNVVLNLLEDVNDASLSFVIAIESDEGNYTALVNRSVSFCKFLKQRSTEPVLRLIYEDMLKQGNFMKMCPIKKGIYTLNEFRLDEEILPSYVPETSFFVEIKLDIGSKNIFQGRLHGKIDKSKGFNNLKMFSLG